MLAFIHSIEVAKGNDLHLSVILFTGGVHPLGRQPQAEPPPHPETGTEADGTHSTGMHSCLSVLKR